MTSIARRFSRQVVKKLTNKASSKAADSIAKGATKAVDRIREPKSPASTYKEDIAKGPKRDISKEIRKHKRNFDYLVIRTEDGPCFVVDGKVRQDKAVAMYLNFYPEADADGTYEAGRARFNVTTQNYEIVGEDAPVQGTFPVHIFHMEG